MMTVCIMVMIMKKRIVIYDEGTHRIYIEKLFIYVLAHTFDRYKIHLIQALTQKYMYTHVHRKYQMYRMQ